MLFRSTDTIDLASYDVGTGTVAFTVTVTDSRHFSATKTLNLTILPYGPPQILSLSIARATGAKATITKTGKVSSIKVGDTEKNTYTALTEYKVTGTTTWGTAKTESNAFANLNLDGFDITKSYDIRVTLTDKLNSISVITFLATTAVNVHFHGQDSVGVGKMWERGTLDVSGDIYSHNRIIRPIGMAYFSNPSNPSYTTPSQIALGTISLIPGTTEISAGVNAFAINKSGIYEVLFQAGVDGFGSNGYAVTALNVNGGDLTWRGYGLNNGHLNFTAVVPLKSGDSVIFRNVMQSQTTNYYYMGGFIRYLGG